MVMVILSVEGRSLFLARIISLQQQLNAVRPDDSLQSIDRIENQLTLKALCECLRNASPEHFNARLSALLSDRWERIRHSNMCYTQQPTNVVNQLCFSLAKAISPPITTASEIAALAPNTGPYCLLMPTLETSEDVYGENIHSLSLHEFILSDDERVFIPLASCLHQASVSDSGDLRHMVRACPALTPGEVYRVSQHSREATAFYQAIIEYNKQRLLGHSLGAKLSQLVVALRHGGSHTGRGTGNELNAG